MYTVSICSVGTVHVLLRCRFRSSRRTDLAFSGVQLLTKRYQNTPDLPRISLLQLVRASGVFVLIIQGMYPPISLEVQIRRTFGYTVELLLKGTPDISALRTLLCSKYFIKLPLKWRHLSIQDTSPGHQGVHNRGAPRYTHDS